jgi:hypothetical protein
MILSKLGYGGRIMAMAFTMLRKRYPEAYEAFKEETEDRRGKPALGEYHS